MQFAQSRNARRFGVAVLSVVASVGTAVLAPTSATAATAPAQQATPPATVSADPLPTVQTNGIVWSTVTVGNTAYATGDFTQARPAGNAKGVGEVPRGGIIAFDVRTGVMTSFSHALNGPGRQLVASPDGRTLYLVGDFTSVDGQARGHIAAFDIATGSLVAGFAPTVNDSALSVAATASAVYVGGAFTNANSAARKRLAAFNPVNGALTTWAPSADNGTVTAITLAPSDDRLVVAGRFTTLNGAARYGIGAVDAVNGGLTAWNSSFPIKNAGVNSSLTSLHTSNGLIYATGYVYGSGGNFEGVAAFDAAGTINYLDSCHGDHYDSFSVNGVTYSASHAHDCSDPRGFPEQKTRIWRRGTANLSQADGSCTEATNTEANYANFAGQPCATMLTWYPEFATGKYSGASQGPWTVSGNSDYVVMGGEFPTVNKVPQEGLVRFAVRNVAPNKVAPKASATLLPTATSNRAGTARVTWQTTSDPDDRALTYRIFRGNSATPVYTVSQTSDFWNLPYLSFLDTGLTPGASQQYRVSVTDPWGNTISTGKSVAVVVSSAQASAYADDVVTDGASDYWRLDETSGTTGANYAGGSPLEFTGGVVGGLDGAVNDGNAAAGFDGATSFGSTRTSAPAPNSFSVEAWFKTTVAGGKIVGYGSSATANSYTYDRHLYIDPAGRLTFGVYNGGKFYLKSPAAVNDGQWHHVVASLGPSGTALWLDGVAVGANAGVTKGQTYSGFWRVGGDASWSGQPFFNGAIDEVAVYPSPLTQAQIVKHFTDSGRTPPG